MKKIILLFLMLFVSSQAYAADKKIEVFKVDNEPIEFAWYHIKDNKLYIDLGYTQEGKGEIFEFENNKFEKFLMTDNEMEDFVKKYEVGTIDDPENKKSDLGNGKTFKREFYKQGESSYSMSIIDENGKEKDISRGRYYLFAFNMYAYIDKEFQKIYLTAQDEKTGKTGLYIYDINNDVFHEIDARKEKAYFENIRYINPIRVPDTPYLMLLGMKDRSNWGLYIEEIPEWKAEIEAKEKSKEPNKSAPESVTKDEAIKTETKYVIDGPANLRDKAKGKKVIGEMADKAEVKIVSQKGDWYEVENGDIKGWTFKDNIKKVK